MKIVSIFIKSNKNWGPKSNQSHHQLIKACMLQNFNKKQAPPKMIINVKEIENKSEFKRRTWMKNGFIYETKNLIASFY